MWSNRSVIFALKFGISAALLIFVLRRLDLGAVGEALSRLTPETILVAAGLYLLAHGLNGVKLQVLMADRPLKDLVRYTFVALYYGTVLPGQLLGDAMKAYRLVRPGDDGATVVAAVVVDKITGLVALVLITGLALLIDPRGFPNAFPALSFALLAGLVLALLLPLVVPKFPNVLDNALGRFLRAWHASARDWGPLFGSLFTGIAFQILSVIVVAYIGTGMGISLSFPAWVAVVGLVSLVLLLPVTVAGVGLREGGLVILLGFVGVAPADAVALSLALLGYTLFGAVVGAIADLKSRKS
ncbi:MAG: flippase-like domain-containing protein [Rhodospirillaceae bacterium]|jgi:glycosyltransferase 2 family protein|nr:flippase-like domain-containing protein [Rhodospirillaceae bacterium]MBT5564896.1 flippase-like domain-containing protein [Rhodospirillaceae bacterium]MBT6090563.1 flippase-like domain-containing protein [Rhodospirillaceae bacterium]